MKLFTGKVISTKMAKTATVEVERIIAHPLYKKRMKKTRLFHVHDEESLAKVGEIVNFRASKPHSKLKKWELVTGKTVKKVEEKVQPVKAVKKVAKKGPKKK